ncbi:MAG: poly(A) polymerase [Porticoccaceae bacterium]|nr:poly(A) polymerase [Porticoccaceae bacterium]
MLKKLFKLFTAPGKATTDPQVLTSGNHPIKRRQISNGAIKTIETLQARGYDAYLVGGCVRDLLLGRHPKDFDVATNATPDQVKELFRRARIVGRRFQIVHVYMGREMVEVTTFRANHNGGHRQAVQSAQGQLLRDNVFGDINEDAQRRDFTVNALYYHPADDTLFDYANGLPDIEARQLRMIGDPETRFREDPVRMLRAARFAAKLDFSLEPATAAPIPELAPLLSNIPPARLFDEFLKLFLAGHALATFRVLREYRLFGLLFPETDELLASDDGFNQRFIEQAMRNTDARIAAGKPVTPAFLLAALLWPVVVKGDAFYRAKGEAPAMAMQKAAGHTVAQQVSRIAIPRRFSLPMREIWEMQGRLPNRSGRRAEHLHSLPRFRAAYDFVLLREQAGEILDNLGDWWTRYQDADPDEREAMVSKLGGRSGGGRRRRRPRKRPPAGATS